jgi:hypothetical protein
LAQAGCGSKLAPADEVVPGEIHESSVRGAVFLRADERAVFEACKGGRGQQVSRRARRDGAVRALGCSPDARRGEATTPAQCWMAVMGKLVAGRVAVRTGGRCRGSLKRPTAAATRSRQDGLVTFPRRGRERSLRTCAKFTYSVDMARFDACRAWRSRPTLSSAPTQVGAYRIEVPKTWTVQALGYAHGYVARFPALQHHTPSIRRHLDRERATPGSVQLLAQYYDVRGGRRGPNGRCSTLSRSPAGTAAS